MSGNILLKKISGAQITGESFAGSDCSGSDGNTSRVLTTVGASTAIGEITLFVDGAFLRETDDYTLSGNDITILIKIWDTQKIDVRYLQ